MILQELIVLFKRIFVLLFDYSPFQSNLSGFYESLFSTDGKEQILFGKEPFSPDWLIIFLFLQVILIAWLRLYYPNRLKLLTNSYFSNRFIDQLTREEKSAGIYNWAVEFLYFLTFSTFLFISNKTFSFFNFKLEWSALDYLVISLGLLLFILVKSLVMSFMAWLFDMETRFEDIHFYRFLNHSILSFSLFPLLILSTYLVPNSNFWLYLAWLFVGIFYLYRLVRSVLRFSSYNTFSFKYIILYICTVEILPLALFVKASFKSLEVSGM